MPAGHPLTQARLRVYVVIALLGVELAVLTVALDRLDEARARELARRRQELDRLERITAQYDKLRDEIDRLEARDHPDPSAAGPEIAGESPGSGPVDPGEPEIGYSEGA
jgi:hypothetical protein